MMGIITIGLTVFLLFIAWIAGGIVYQMQNENLKRETRRLRHFNNIITLARKSAEGK